MSHAAPLAEIEAEALAAIAAAETPQALDAARVAALGKQGSVTGLMKRLGALPPEQKREFGQAVNALKERLGAAIEARQAEVEAAALTARLAAERVDVTLPPRPTRTGHVHPIGQTLDELVEIFGQMGFRVAEGPDVEDDFHNFTALNIPPEHPARQMHDTFYLPPGADGTARLLRTHTSPVQVRTMLSQKPPIRIIAPGRTFRSDYDMTHTPMFHQVEALVIEEGITMAHLKGCVRDFCRAFFEVDDLPVRFRPSFFPFTEPSAEVDIGCKRVRAGETGELKIGPYGDWLEILGSGMVHPKVLAACGIDPERYQGFAFGMGIERIAMLKYGIPDLRTFFEADVRWLAHYGFAAHDRPSRALGRLA